MKYHSIFNRAIRFNPDWAALFTLLLALLLVECGGGGGGSAPQNQPPAPTAPWTGTKQLGGANALGVAVDLNGNVYLTGNTSRGLDGNTLTGTSDLFVTKYDASGNKVRTKQLGVTGKNTVATSIAMDAAGNVLVAGYTNGGLDGNSLQGWSDFFVTKYDQVGNKIYTKQLGVWGADTYARGVAVDLNGNVYVAGATSGGLDGNTLTGSTDLFVTKYDAFENRVRTLQLGATMAYTGARGIAVDKSGNIYVAGSTGGGLDGNFLKGTSDIFLVKYDPAGNNLYTKQFGIFGKDMHANGVAVDSRGYVYVAGFVYTVNWSASDFLVIQYDPSGSVINTVQLGVAGKYTMAHAIAVDANDNVYVTGYTSGGLDGNILNGFNDYFLTKFDPNPSKVYTRQIGVTGGYAIANGVAGDASGNAYVAGSTDGDLDRNILTGNGGSFVAKYDTSGNRQ